LGRGREDDSRSIEELHLEALMVWRGEIYERLAGRNLAGARWFPFVAVEDTFARVLWGAQLGLGSSWQMEVGRQFDPIAISGGLADRNLRIGKKDFGAR